MIEKKRARIVVIGSFMMDFVVRVNRMAHVGETLRGNSFHQFPGGKGANQASAAAKLGADVAMIGRVGRDVFGDELLHTARITGIDTTWVIQDDHHATGIASIVVDETGRNQIIIVPGANEACTEEDVIKAQDVIEAADMVMLQCEIPLATVTAALRLASKMGTLVLWNPAPAPKHPLAPHELAHIDVITPNEVEAEQLTGIRVENKEEAARAGERLLHMGVRSVVVTLGEHGAVTLAAGQSDPVFVPAYSVQAVDTVAAGDAFNGALAVSLAQGTSLEDAAKYANAVAAIAVTRQGAHPSLPTREEVNHFLRGYDKT